MASSDDDRTVHGVSMSGLYEIVRYDRQGHWFYEREGEPRRRCSVKDAARVAADGTAYVGLPGGQVFDAAVRRMRAQT